MRCKTCDYPLFDIRERTCPECGGAFKPSDFDFNQSAVKFCCPHCAQDYYGMDARGHLVPPEFDCVRCGTHVHMDDMVMQPTAGIKDEETQQATVPWLDPRRRSTFKRFFATLGWGMAKPTDLARALSTPTSTWRAMLFALSVGLSCTLFVLPFFLVTLSGRSTYNMLTDMAIAIGVLFGVATGGIAIMIVVWAAVAQLILRVTGPTRGMGYTLRAIAYTSAPCVLLAVPCIGVYATPLSIFWWGLALTLVLRRLHGTSWVRAIAAAWCVPLVALAGVVWAIVMLVSWFSGVTAAARTPPPPMVAPGAPVVAPAAPTTPSDATPPPPPQPGDGVTDPAPEKVDDEHARLESIK